MKSNDVLVLSRKLIKANSEMNYAYLLVMQSEGSVEKETYLARFLVKKTCFATLLDAMQVSSKDAGFEFMLRGYGRDDS